ncbi:MAG TPA: inositol monophosphatase family protein [Pseudomonadales bacterium]|nr:inositol monophosphatase family protein [Pseudomonadales bacterium]
MQPMLNIALRAARLAGEHIVRASDRLDIIAVTEKSSNDYVTEVDQAAEDIIIKLLHKTYPDHGFLAEESGSTNADAEFCWIIDPLDGTTNFVRGIPHYAVSIACQHQGRLEHAVVYNPVTREEFTASRGRGAQLNGRRIRVSGRTNLEGALLGTGIPFHSHHNDKLQGYLQTLAELAPQTAGIRRAGSAALDLAYVAAGRFDAFWEMGLQPWDIAAGLLLIQEAGGLASDFSGGNHYMETGDVVCGNPKCFKQVLKVVNQHLA